MTIRDTAELHHRRAGAPFCWHLTPESFAALAVEHLCLLDLACSAILAGVWLAGVVATFTHAAAVQTVTAVLLQVEHPVVDIQHADAAHETCGHRCPSPYAEERKGTNVVSFIVFLSTQSLIEPASITPLTR